VKYHKRLLVLTSTFPRWKDDTDPPFVYELCLRLKKHYDIHVLAPHYPGSAIEEKLAGLQVTRFRYFMSSWEFLAYGTGGGILAKLKRSPGYYGLIPFFFVGELISTIRILRRCRYDLIHAHWLIPQGLIAVIAIFLTSRRIPVLCTSHGGDLYGLKGWLPTRLKKWIITNSKALTVVSWSMREEVKGLVADHEKVHVIPMGTDLKNRFIPPKTRQNKGSLLFVGRLVEKKGLRYLIDALPLILKKHPQASLRIAGDGPEKGTLQSQSKRLGISDHVRFLGAVKNELLPALYQTSYVVVFPSVIANDGDREGFGLVLVEALGCECATVVTDLPAIQDIVVDGKTGFVVPQKNVQKLAEKIISLLDDPEMGQSVGKKGGRFVVERYDWDEIAKQYAALIESITR
jgi:glycosyltransferase involved in cell wall biosynthesis